MKKINMKKTVIGLSSLFLLAACNGGGGGGSNDTPAPTPSPTPSAEMKPLTFNQYYTDKNGVIQNGAFSMNKVGGHQVWYMVVTNPNSFAISDNSEFTYENNGSPINPTQYSTSYNGEISGVTKQCNSIFGHGKFEAGEKCAYKFEAMWGENISESTNFSIKMSYNLIEFSKLGNNPTVYVVKSNCVDQPFYNRVCLNGIDSEGMSFNLMNLTQSSGDIYGYIGSSEVGGVGTTNVLSIDGTKMWILNQNSGTATRYSVSYNSSTNQISKILDNSWSGLVFSGTGLSENGENMFSNVYNQYGEMTNINPTGDINQYMNWTYGMDGQLYTTGFNYNYYYILNQTPDAALKNETKSRLAPQLDNNSYIKGVSKNGNLWTKEGIGYYSCLNKNNNYAATDMNMMGLVDIWQTDAAKIGADGYRLKLSKQNYYTDLKGGQDAVALYNLINIDACQVEPENYLTTIVSLTSQYGIYNADNGISYVLPKSSFSDGTNGN